MGLRTVSTNDSSSVVELTDKEGAVAKQLNIIQICSESSTDIFLIQSLLPGTVASNRDPPPS